MTEITFHSREGRLSGFTVSGHSGYAQAGSDIVCAAVTSAVRLTECTVNDVLGLAASVKADPERARVSLRLPGGLGQADESVCQTLLAGMMVYLSQLQEEYPNYLFVCEDEG